MRDVISQRVTMQMQNDGLIGVLEAVYRMTYIELVLGYQGKAFYSDGYSFQKFRALANKKEYIAYVVADCEQFFMDNPYHVGIDGNYIIEKAREEAKHGI